MNKGQQNATAFTLLEVLLASALSTVMLLGLWSLLSLHIRLFTKAPAGVEESQLVRSLALQLSHDLSSALPVLDAAMPGAAQRPYDNVADSSLAMRHARLIGTQNSLQVDVLRASVSETTNTWTHGSHDPSDAAPRGTRVSELRTVSYSFAEPAAAERSEDAAQSGLIRQEWSWDTPAPEMVPEQTMDDMRQSPFRSDVPSNRAEKRASSDAQRLRDSIEATNLAPEVVSLGFRYFDGHVWSPWWDSRERKTLPVAVEVLLYLRTDVEGTRRPPSTGDVADGARSRREPEGHRVRMVVHLPASAPQSPLPAAIPSQHTTQPTVRELAPTGTGPS
jgi:hypothetical protein